MSRSELSLFSYEVMGLVGRGGAGPHDLLRMARRGRILDWAGESQYYVEPKRLARLGYLEARKEPGQTRARTVYTLTDKGLEALREWARTPVTLHPAEVRAAAAAADRRPRRRGRHAREHGDAARRPRRPAARGSTRARRRPRRCPTAASTCCWRPLPARAARPAPRPGRRRRARPSPGVIPSGAPGPRRPALLYEGFAWIWAVA